MITDFIKTANGRSTEIELPEKVYNIMGDYPETIAEYVVPKIIKNEKNGKIVPRGYNGYIGQLQQRDLR